MLLTAICIMKRSRQNTDMLRVVTGRIICSDGCQQILSGMHRLVQESRAKGAIRLAPPDYPPGFAVTITAGQDNSTESQTDIILPAAVNLLPSFAHDHRELASWSRVLCTEPISFGTTTRHTQLFCSRMFPAMGLSMSRCGLRLCQPAEFCAEFYPYT